MASAPTFATAVVDRIDRQLLDLAADRDRLQAARAILLTTDGDRRPSPARPRRQVRRPAAPSYEVVPVGKLLALLRGTEGLRTAELAAACNGDPALIREVLAEQESAGEVRRSGAGPSTRWRLITDEDRIAARVSELEARGG